MPVSSSAHLILFPHGGLGRPGAGIRRSRAPGHARRRGLVLPPGSVRHDRDWFASLARRERVGDNRLAWAVILGTIPASIAGLLFKGFIEEQMRSPLVIAWATIGFGLLLWWSDVVSRRTPQPRDEHSLSWKDILLIGCAQALALIPGTSRSGVTMTAGLLLGLSRSGAARFSFCCRSRSSCLPVAEHARSGGRRGSRGLDGNGAGGGAVGDQRLPVHPLFLKLLERVGMLPFVIYRLILGAVLLVLFSGVW